MNLISKGVTYNNLSDIPYYTDISKVINIVEFVSKIINLYLFITLALNTF